MIKKVLFVVRIFVEWVFYVEVYGMGIFLGDLVEIKVFEIVYGENCSLECFLIIGLVKINIGYIEVVVGIVGLIKVVLFL